MSWYKAVLTHQQVAAGELITLLNDFEYVFRDLGEPKGMALFQGEITPAGYIVYFSPGCLPRASYIIASYSGSPCEKPRKENLKYLGGDMGGPLISFHATVRGRVQGVFFRAFVRRHATALGLTGYVRNLTQLRAVEVEAEGERSQLEELLKRLYQGPPRASVEKVEVTWGDYAGNFSDFKIRKSV